MALASDVKKLHLQHKFNTYIVLVQYIQNTIIVIYSWPDDLLPLHPIYKSPNSSH